MMKFTDNASAHAALHVLLLTSGKHLLPYIGTKVDRPGIGYVTVERFDVADPFQRIPKLDSQGHAMAFFQGAALDFIFVTEYDGKQIRVAFLPIFRRGFLVHSWDRGSIQCFRANVRPGDEYPVVDVFSCLDNKAVEADGKFSSLYEIFKETGLWKLSSKE